MYVPVTVPPFKGLKPAVDVSVIVAGVALWQESPMGVSRPAILRSVSFRVICEVAWMAPVVLSMVPVVCPS